MNLKNSPKNPESSDEGGYFGGRKSEGKWQAEEDLRQAITNFVFSQHVKLEVRGRNSESGMHLENNLIIIYLTKVWYSCAFFA